MLEEQRTGVELPLSVEDMAMRRMIQMIAPEAALLLLSNDMLLPIDVEQVSLDQEKSQQSRNGANNTQRTNYMQQR